VQVEAGADQLVPPNAREQRLLDRLGASPDVRLGCQICITKDSQPGSRVILRVLAGNW
jgi:ferredoxin